MKSVAPSAFFSLPGSVEGRGGGGGGVSICIYIYVCMYVCMYTHTSACVTFNNYQQLASTVFVQHSDLQGLVLQNMPQPLHHAQTGKAGENW